MSRLALLAVLLMALVPSVSRMMARADTQVLEGWVELCTTSGLKWFDTGKQSESGKTSPAKHDAWMGENCAYCRLVDLLPPILLLVLLVFPCLHALHVAHACAPLQRMLRNVRGLGSQAPPFPL